MPNPDLPVDPRQSVVPPPSSEVALFDRLRELARQGYVPAADAAGVTEGDILLRHESGPNLILKRDGSLDLPLLQPLKSQPAQTVFSPIRRMSKRRTFAVILLALAFWMFSMFITVLIANGM